MDSAAQARMLKLWRATVQQCQETLDVWHENDFRVVVNGIDITDAEKAATVARIAHLKGLIAAVEAYGGGAAQRS